jgi:type II secretory pathway pseudopilin PulG
MEIVVAIGLIATISLLVIGTLARLLSTGGKSAHQTAATLLAQEVLDSAVAAGPPNWGFPTSDRTGVQNLILPGEESSTPFDFKIDVVRLRQSPDDLGTVQQVTATVWWWGDEPASRVEQGRTAVTATRTVYIRGEVPLP